MKILIYDVETACADVSSICQVAWLLITNDAVTDSDCALIDPHCDFNGRNVAIHGITPQAVYGAPCFADYYTSTLAPLFKESLVLAHNAAFDISATLKALTLGGITPEPFLYADTVPLLRTLIDSPNYKLTTLAAMVDYAYEPHDALEDCRALLAVLRSALHTSGHDDLISMILHSRTPIKLSVPEEKKEHAPNPFAGLNYKMNDHFRGSVEPLDDVLSGLRFVLSGECADHPREDVEREIALHKGKATMSVSKRTDYLVLGTYGAYGTEYVSGKRKLAQQLNAEGAHIQIITYEQLFRMMEDHK